MELPQRKIYTVSELTDHIRELLEKQYPSVWIQGEVSNFHAAPSGHLYFTLKDRAAQIRCVMFKIQSRFLKFRMEDGLHIIGWGRISVYNARGEYQLILDTLEPAGLGSLMLAFEQLKDRLTAEGLFDAQRKKPIPRFPRAVGLVTSPRGAAVRDMIRIVRRRFPGMHILVSPASVQGDKAPEEIVSAIERLCESGKVDVIIVGRGGGSIEDLWAFNDERVVRAVAVCPLPVVSAVGHETDFTLTDFAADLRASTPSAAAELVAPDRKELTENILHLTARMTNGARGRIAGLTEVLVELRKRLYDPRRQIQERRMKIDDLTVRLMRGVSRHLQSLRRESESLWVRLRPEHLHRVLAVQRQECAFLRDRLGRAVRLIVDRRRGEADNLIARLDAVSPLAVLSRGYSITMRSDTREILTDEARVEPGDEVDVRLHHGELSCRVMTKRTPEETLKDS